ncbi:MAG: hypothetical protein LBR92_02155, partial [Puniceicoccales bacterium]|nr:hypothetical protein [Puniceicoccales bacterium]
MGAIGKDDYFRGLQSFATDLNIKGAKEETSVEGLMKLIGKAEIWIADGKIQVKMGTGSEVTTSPLQDKSASELNNIIKNACGNNADIEQLLNGSDEDRARVFTAFMKYGPDNLQKALVGDDSAREGLIKHLKGEPKTDSTLSMDSSLTVAPPTTKLESASNDTTTTRMNELSGSMQALTKKNSEQTRKFANCLEDVPPGVDRKTYKPPAFQEVRDELADNYSFQTNRNDAQLTKRRWIGSEDCEIDLLQKSDTQIETDIAKLNQEVAKLESEIGPLENERKELIAKGKAPTVALARLCKEERKIEEELQGVNNEIEQIKKNISDIDERIGGMGTGFFKTYTPKEEEEKKKLEQTKKTLEADIKQLEQKQRTLQEELKQKKEASKSKEEECNSLSKSAISKHDTLEAKKKNIATKKGEITTKQHQLDKNWQELDARFHKLCDPKKDELISLRQQIRTEQSPEKRAELEKKAKTLNNEICNLLEKTPISERTKNQYLSMMSEHLDFKFRQMGAMIGEASSFIEAGETKNRLCNALSELQNVAREMTEEMSNANPSNRFELEELTGKFATKLCELDNSVRDTCGECFNGYVEKGKAVINGELDKMQSSLDSLSSGTSEYTALEKKRDEMIQIKNLMDSVAGEITSYYDEKIGRGNKSINQKSLGTHVHDLKTFKNFIENLERYQQAVTRGEDTTSVRANLILDANSLVERHEKSEEQSPTDSAAEPTNAKSPVLANLTNRIATLMQNTKVAAEVEAAKQRKAAETAESVEEGVSDLGGGVPAETLTTKPDETSSESNVLDLVGSVSTPAKEGEKAGEAQAESEGSDLADVASLVPEDTPTVSVEKGEATETPTPETAEELPPATEVKEAQVEAEGLGLGGEVPAEMLSRSVTDSVSTAILTEETEKPSAAVVNEPPKSLESGDIEEEKVDKPTVPDEPVEPPATEAAEIYEIDGRESEKEVKQEEEILEVEVPVEPEVLDLEDEAGLEVVESPVIPADTVTPPVFITLEPVSVPAAEQPEVKLPEPTILPLKVAVSPLLTAGTIPTLSLESQTEQLVANTTIIKPDPMKSIDLKPTELLPILSEDLNAMITSLGETLLGTPPGTSRLTQTEAEWKSNVREMTENLNSIIESLENINLGINLVEPGRVTVTPTFVKSDTPRIDVKFGEVSGPGKKVESGETEGVSGLEAEETTPAV